MSRAAHWNIHRVDTAGLNLHLILTPVEPANDLTFLTIPEQAEFWDLLNRLVEEYGLTHYSIAVPATKPIEWHLLSGATAGPVRVDMFTGGLHTSTEADGEPILLGSPGGAR